MRRLGILFSIALWAIPSIAQLSGNYIIDTLARPGYDYTSISAAVADLHTYGISGATHFDIRDGIYNEQFELNAISGSSSSNLVTFQGSALVTIRFAQTSTNNYIVRLNGVEHVMFRDIVWESLGSSYGRIVEFSGTTRSITFHENVFYGLSTTSTSSDHSVISSYYVTELDNIEFDENFVYNGSYGISIGGGASVTNSNVTINGNFLNGQWRGGIVTTRFTGIDIQENIIQSVSTDQNMAGISVSYGIGGEVKKNKVLLNGDGYGIYIGETNNSTTTPFEIHNNFLTIRGANNTGYAIRMDGLDDVEIAHNSMFVTGTPGQGALLSWNDAGSSSTSLYNNLGQINSGGPAIHSSVSTIIFTGSDYNTFRHNTGNYAEISGTTYTNIASWRTATSLDSSTKISFVPVPYTNASVGDLHLTSVPVSLRHPNTPYAADDFDSDTRPTTPNVAGADLP